MPSILSSKRSKLIIAAVAGALTLATTATAAAATLPSGSGSAAATAPTADARLMIVTERQAPAHGDAMTAGQQLVAFDKVRFSLGERQHENDVAVAKAAAAKAAAAEYGAKRTAAGTASTASTPSTPSGTPVQIAQLMLARYGWSSSQMSCLYPLWYHESGWNPSAENPGSGAYGIPQSLPGSQMASAGRDWATNPATQIRWGMTYIQGRYGSPCGAWAHEQADNWY